MANLTKEEFQRKTDCANRFSREGLDKIVYSILTKNTTEKKSPELQFIEQYALNLIYLLVICFSKVSITFLYRTYAS